MGWYPCTCCKDCCNDLTVGCGCICFGKTPCATTLSITGNHPAESLVFPISYSRNPIVVNTLQFCGLSGCAPIDLLNSVGHTFTRTWEEKERLWDKIKADKYYCCQVPGSDPVPYLLSRIEGNGVYVASRCYKAAIRYLNLEVDIRQGKRIVYGETICGIDVNVRLTYQRFFDYRENRCQYRYGKINYFSVPCITYPVGGEPQDVERACSVCQPGGGSFTPGSDYSTEPYPSVPSCPDPVWTEGNPDEDPNIPNGVRCITRSKFIPNIESVSCNNVPFTVTLGPELNSGLFPGTQDLCCGKNRDYPDLAYYDYAELQDYNCSAWSNCRGTFEETPAYGTWISPPADFPGFGNLTGSSIGNCTTEDDVNIDQCLYSEITERSRGKNLVRPLENHTLLFGELNDTWTLNILCSG